MKKITFSYFVLLTFFFVIWSSHSWAIDLNPTKDQPKLPSTSIGSLVPASYLIPSTIFTVPSTFSTFPSTILTTFSTVSTTFPSTFSTFSTTIPTTFSTFPTTFPTTFSTFPTTFSTFPTTFSTFPTTFPTTFSTFPTTFSTFPTTYVTTWPTTKVPTTNMPWIPLLLLDDESGGPTCPVIPNGDFESGPTIWTEYSLLGWDLILSDFTPNSTTPHSGSYAVWLGGDHNETCYIQQIITISSACPFLSFYHSIGSEDVCGYDFGYVRINGANVASLNLCLSGNTNGWVENRINLSSYADQTVTLQFRAQTDESGMSNWFIDDVSFKSTD